jgi:hypothetical protein
VAFFRLQYLDDRGVALVNRSRVVIALGVSQTLAWGSTYYLPAILAVPMARDLGLSTGTVFAAFSSALVGPAQVAARLLEFSLLQRFHPLLSAKLAVIAHPIGALGVMTLGAPLATLFVLLHGAGNGILTIAKGTLPLAIFGPQGYGLRQGVLMVPARFGQALAPLTFALLIERFGTQALLFSAALGLSALAALHVLQHHAIREAT